MLYKKYLNSKTQIANFKYLSSSSSPKNEVFEIFKFKFIYNYLYKNNLQKSFIN